MATQKEEKEEQEFFAEKLKEQKEMEKHTSHEAKNAKHGEQDIERDHLGQGINPAIELEKENMAKAAERHEKEVKDAEKSVPHAGSKGS